MEIDVGSWSGLTVDEISARFPEGFRRWADWRTTGWDDGESYDELGARVVAGLHELGRTHPGARILAVTHGGPIRVVLATATGLAFDEVHGRFGAFENCAVFSLAVEAGRIELVD
jgi:probable phosphoglycerate mutase